jgi:glucose-1-phosphate thymidylyltransferase
MKGVILAGGSGKRLRPLTAMINKHLLPVGKYPMIYYSIDKMRSAGIYNILLIISKQSAALYMDFLGSGQNFGVRITYKIQEDAGGIAQALQLAEDFVQPEEKLVVLLGDNLFEESFARFVQEFEKQPQGAKVLLKQVEDPHRFGVPVLSGDIIERIEEKPEYPLSSYCVTGIYMYDASVFSVIQAIQPSARGELEITDVNNWYAERGMLTFNRLSGWWIDAGTFTSLFEASEQLRDFEGAEQ